MYLGKACVLFKWSSKDACRSPTYKYVMGWELTAAQPSHPDDVALKAARLDLIRSTTALVYNCLHSIDWNHDHCKFYSGKIQPRWCRVRGERWMCPPTANWIDQSLQLDYFRDDDVMMMATSDLRVSPAVCPCLRGMIGTFSSSRLATGFLKRLQGGCPIDERDREVLKTTLPCNSLDISSQTPIDREVLPRILSSINHLRIKLQKVFVLMTNFSSWVNGTK